MTLTVAPYAGPPASWDHFGQSRPGWTHFHGHGWKSLIEEVFGHECPYLAATDQGDRLAGVLPLVRVRSRIFGHYLVSMPFLNYGGPLGEPEAVRALATAASAKAAEDGADLLELRSRAVLPLDLPVSHRKITVVLPLPPDRDALWKGFGSKLRNQVRRPEKAGVEIRVGEDQVGPFYQVFARHMRDLGTPVLPRRWFEAIAERFGDAIWFGVAWHEGHPVAGGVAVRWAGEVEMTWASALASHSRLAANMLLYARFMERAVDAGASLFNFGRCSPGSGTHRFKQQWGARDEPLWWYQSTPRGRGAGDARTPSPDQGALALGPRVWKHLPLPLATALGPHIVRFIP